MRIKGVIHKNCVTMLVDSGSTHNFLSVQLAKRSGFHPDKNTSFEVLVANGGKSESQGRCDGIQVWLNGTPFVLEFYLLPLSGYDSVLSAQWLMTLGPILWDFSKLLMSFQWKGREITLTGLAPPANKLIEWSKMTKKMWKRRRNPPSNICCRTGCRTETRSSAGPAYAAATTRFSGAV